MFELFLNINNFFEKIDISGDIVLNNHLVDISDIGDIGTIYSYTFDILKTNNNLILLDSLSLNGSNSNIPYKNIECKIIYNGNVIIPKGFLVYISNKEKTFEAIINSGNFNFFDNIKNKNISELDLPEYELWTNVSAVANGWGLMNLNYDFKTIGNDQNLNNFRPFITFKKILDQISLENKITVNTKIDLSKFNFPLLNDSADDTIRERAGIEATKSYYHFEPSTGTVYGLTGLTKIADYYGRLYEGTINYITTSIYKVNVNTNLRVSIFASISDGHILVYHNSNIVIAFSPTESHEDITIQCEKNDLIYLIFEKISEDDDSTISNFKFIIDELDFEVTTQKFDYPIRKNLPKITQLDFIKLILKLFGLFVYIDNEKRILYLFNLDDVVKNYNAGNYSIIENIIDIDEINYQYGDFAQENNFIYSKNNDYPLDEDFGSYKFIIDYLRGSKTYQKINFAPSKDCNFLTLLHAQIKKYTYSSIAASSGGSILSANDFNNNNELQDRILCNSYTNLDINVINEDLTSTFYSNYNRLFFNDLDFENLVPKYWKTFLDTVEKPVIYKIKVDMDNYVFSHFDFRKPLKLSDINGIFFVTEIAEFKPDKKTATLTLLKIK